MSYFELLLSTIRKIAGFKTTNRYIYLLKSTSPPVLNNHFMCHFASNRTSYSKLTQEQRVQ